MKASIRTSMTLPVVKGMYVQAELNHTYTIILVNFVTCQNIGLVPHT